MQGDMADDGSGGNSFDDYSRSTDDEDMNGSGDGSGGGCKLLYRQTIIRTFFSILPYFLLLIQMAVKAFLQSST